MDFMGEKKQSMREIDNNTSPPSAAGTAAVAFVFSFALTSQQGFLRGVEYKCSTFPTFYVQLWIGLL